MDSSRSRRMAGLGAALVALLLASGCSACDSARCGVDPEWPRFGSAFERLFERTIELPATVADDWNLRTDRLADYGQTWWGCRGLEFERTGGHLADFGPDVADDFERHGGALVGFLGRQGERAGDDVCCLFSRTWHTIKLATE